MSIILTSFKRSSMYPGKKFSVAPYQPRGFNYPELLCLAPIDMHGKGIRSSKFFCNSSKEEADLFDFLDDCSSYRKAVMQSYIDRSEEIRHVLSAFNRNSQIVFASWGPYTANARRQISKTGIFACHSGIIAEILTIMRPDLKVILDVDRSRWLVPTWQHGTLEQGWLKFE